MKNWKPLNSKLHFESSHLSLESVRNNIELWCVYESHVVSVSKMIDEGLLSEVQKKQIMKLYITLVK